MNERIYLDYNATAPLHPRVKEAIIETMEHPLNASSMHFYGQNSRRLLQETRHHLAEIIDAHPDHIIFTSGGTEANNHVLQSPIWKTVITSEIEHDSVYKAPENALRVPVLESGAINLQALEKVLKSVALDPEKTPFVVSLIWAHNETGAITPIEDAQNMVHSYGGFLHVDGVQAFGKLPIKFRWQKLDLLTLSFHKIGGPQGIGALVCKESVPLPALIRGGGQEKGRRSGTENIMALSGLKSLLEFHSPKDLSHLRKWHDDMEAFFMALGAQDIYAKSLPRLCNTTCLRMEGVANHIQVMTFDLQGFCVSAGSACSSGTTKISRSLLAHSKDPQRAAETIRISSGWNTTKNDLLAFSKAWSQLLKERVAVV